GDHYVSMKRGPVLSTVLDIIHEGDQEGYWSRFITAPEKYCVRLQCPAPDSELSPAECDLLDHLSRRFRKHDRWQMVDVVHTLPEWRDPGDSAIPISYEDILRATCKPDDV